MKFVEMPTKELLALHNRIADKPAGPKTFATRARLIARIEEIADAKGIHPRVFEQPAKPAATGDRAQHRAVATETTSEPMDGKKRQGKGIGALARAILLDPVGYPHALVAAMVNAQVEGAAATAKSVRWYANDMRKRGIEVPPRHRAYPAEMDEQQSTEWLSTVRVAGGSEE